VTTRLADVGTWLALALPDHVHHDATVTWFDAVNEPATILFCRSTQQSFLRLLTNAAVLGPYGIPPLRNSEAWRAYDELLADDRIAFREDEPDGLEPAWRQFASRPSSSPKLWMDAYLAAFARAGQYQLVTTDTAFRQFAGLDLLVLDTSGAS
jgi:toxin-antitoxin system PIN domain toxin